MVCYEDADAVIIRTISRRGGDQPLSESSNRFCRPWTRCMNTCIACCANRSRVHTLSSLGSVSCISFFSCGTPFYFRPVSVSLPRVLFVASISLSDPSFHLRHLSRGGEQDRRALFIQLPYLNVALTRRKIICKNPHKICKSPLMHREIVALYRRAYGIVTSPDVFISHHRSLVAKKGA